MRQNLEKRKYLARFAFLTFSFLDNLLQFLLEIVPPFVRHIYFKATCKRFGRRVMIDYRCYIRYPHKVSFGNDVAINRGCQIFPSLMNRCAEVVFCDGAVLGPNVTIFGAGQNPRHVDLPDVADSVIIGKGVYVGGNSVIRYGVKIGDFAVVAAGSIVVSDVPPWTIVGGVPAKLISRRIVATEVESEVQD